uniref:Uncharacterized protein n=1 Tax=Eutreptiella gymnastica TaxID=73025 RepID=A0A7S4G795_9EUGL
MYPHVHSIHIPLDEGMRIFNECNASRSLSEAASRQQNPGFRGGVKETHGYTDHDSTQFQIPVNIFLWKTAQYMAHMVVPVQCMHRAAMSVAPLCTTVITFNLSER